MALCSWEPGGAPVVSNSNFKRHIRLLALREQKPPAALGNDGGQQGMGQGQPVVMADVARNGPAGQVKRRGAERQDQDLSSARGSCAIGTEKGTEIWK
jgi:hypothetical protein